MLCFGDFLFYIADQTAALIFLRTVVLDESTRRGRIEEDALLARIIEHTRTDERKQRFRGSNLVKKIKEKLQNRALSREGSRRLHAAIPQ